MEPSTTDLRLYCFGGFNFITNNKEIVNLGSNKANALLIYLAIESPQNFSRSHLAGLLWSDFSENNARQNLRQTLLRLRKDTAEVLGEDPLLISMQEQIMINPKINLWVDVLAFEDMLSIALKFYDDHNRYDRLDIQNLIAASNLFSGAFLDRVYFKDSILFNEWAAMVQERTNRKAIEAGTLLCNYYQRRGEYHQAGKYADRIMSLNPWDHQACANCMGLMAAQKQWGAAKGYYYNFKNYLNNTLDLAPDSSLTALFHKIKDLSLKNEALTLDEPKVSTNLPKFSSTFIGREQELSDLTGLLANPKTRLISIIGMGGVGKTRLAIRIGHIMHGLYAHGVFFAPLRDINALSGFLNLLSESLGLTLSDASPYQDQIIRYLKNKQCLIILDNFEHLILQQEFIDFQISLLENAPNVKTLTTSRERLNLCEEHVYLLAGLDCIPSDETGNYNKPVTDALSLFEERAKQVNYQFKLTEKTVSDVNMLCCMVEGHPLSIELMASAVPYKATSDILSELKHDLLELKSPLTNIPQEHRSLAVVLERSWGLLSENQKSTLCKLACFSGDFSGEAAIEVAQATKNTLSSLVSKSFIRTTDFIRYDLHEIIHQFARAKSTELNLLDLAKRAHAEYFCHLLGRAGELFHTGDQNKALDIIEADLDNIRSAWLYYIEKKAFDKLINGIDIFHKFYNIRSKFEEGFTLFLKTLNAAHCLEDYNPFLGILLNRLGSLAHRLYYNEKAFNYFSRSQSIFLNTGNCLELGTAYLGLGNYYLRAKDSEQALKYGNKSLVCFQSLDNPYLQGTAYFLLGNIYLRIADFNNAEKMFSQSLELARQTGDQRGILLRLNQLAGIACNKGDFDAAQKLYTESLALCRSFKDQFNEAIVLNNLASVYHPRKQYDQEETVLKKSLDICREIGDLEGEAVALNNLGELALVQGDVQKTFKYSKQALDMALKIKEDWTIIAAYDILGEAYLAEKDIPSAEQCFRQAIRTAYKIKAFDLLTRSTVNASQVYLQRGENDSARSLLEAAVAHPGILYEYNLKARELLKDFGFEPSNKKDDKLILGVLERYFNLETGSL